MRPSHLPPSIKAKLVPHFKLSSHTRELSTLALPILGGQAAQAGNGFVDTIMAGQVGPVALAGVAVGTSIWLPLYLFMLGILMNATPVSARLRAAQKHAAANATLQQALLLGLALSTLIIIALLAVEPLLSLLKVAPELIPTVTGYLLGISSGAPAAAIFLVQRSYVESIKQTAPVFWISLVGLLINIPFNYLLIHGKFGLPALGGAGCGWATSISFWCMVLLMHLHLKHHPRYRQSPLRMFPLQLDSARLLSLLKLGLPSGFALFFEVSIFALIALLIGSLGAVTTAGHQITLNLSSLTFMVPLSLSLATSIRVGHARGLGDVTQLHSIIRHAFRASLFIGALLTLLLLALHQWLPLIYSHDTGVTSLASSLLILAAFYQLSDAWQVTANGCLRGFEDTTWSMFITLLTYWGISLPLGYTLGMTNWLVPAMGPAGFWWAIILGLTIAAALLTWRLHILLRRVRRVATTA